MIAIVLDWGLNQKHHSALEELAHLRSEVQRTRSVVHEPE